MHSHDDGQMWRRWRVAGFALLCAVAVGAAHAKVAPLAELPVERQRVAQVEGPAAWWMGLGESALVALQRAAHVHASAGSSLPSAQAAADLALDARVAAAYVVARTAGVRSALTTQWRESIARQRELLGTGAPTRERAAAVATLDAQLAYAERFAASLMTQRDAAVAVLAEACGTSPAELRVVLQAALSAREIPVFAAATPQRLPRSVLKARADVSAIEGRLLLGRKLFPLDDYQTFRGESVLAGWIETRPQLGSSNPTAAPSSVPAADTMPDLQPLLAVTSLAENEVRANLVALQARTAEAQRLLQVVQTRRVELGAAQRRSRLGEGSEPELVRTYQLLLADNDRLAVAGGELAVAWIRLQASTGGQALQARGPADE